MDLAGIRSAAGVSEAVRTVRKMEQSSLSVVAFGQGEAG
jgi:hypothetical protein